MAIDMKGILKKEKKMEKELFIIVQEVNFKVILRMIW